MKKNHFTKYWYIYLVVAVVLAVGIYYIIKVYKAKKDQNDATQNLTTPAYGGGTTYTNVDATDDPLLKKGVSGEKVKALQLKLNSVAATLTASGKPTEPGQATGTIAVDGYFGNYTEQMLRYVSKNGQMGTEVTEIKYSKINQL